MLKSVLKLLIKLCESTGAYINITGTSKDDVYMIRYYVIPRNKFFNIYIHRFMRSDRDDFHDHPWDFCTWIAEGSYREEMPNKKSRRGTLVNYRSTLSYKFAFRKATDLHRVMLDRHYSLEEKEMAPLTLCITGPVKREWGFVKKGKWIDWKTYLGVAPDAKER